MKRRVLTNNNMYRVIQCLWRVRGHSPWAIFMFLININIYRSVLYCNELWLIVFHWLLCRDRDMFTRTFLLFINRVERFFLATVPRYIKIKIT